METGEKSLQDPTITHRLFQLITNMSDDERRNLLKLLESGILKGRSRRKYFRKPLSMPITYASESRSYRNFIKDISLGGVFILTRTRFAVGQEVGVDLNNAVNGNPLKILGKVTRITPEGIGVEFSPLNSDKKMAILSLAS
jgi:Tfp pilus assembly protein PilZ